MPFRVDDIGVPDYGLIESDEFLECRNKIGNHKRFDDALVGIIWALSNNPKVYRIVDGMKDVRLLKTDLAGDVPAMRIWFRIDDRSERVILLFLDTIVDSNDGNE